MLTPLLIILNGNQAFTNSQLLDWQRGDEIVALGIEEVSQRVLADQQQLTDQTVAQMVEQGIQKVLYLQGNYTLKDFTYKTQGETTNGDIQISQLDVYVKKAILGEQVSTDSDITGDLAIDPIEDIPVIQIDPIQISEQTRDQESPRNPQTNQSQGTREIQQMLSKQLEIHTNRINVYIVEEG